MYLFREVLIYRQVTEWLWNVVSHALNQHALSAAPVNIMLVQMLSFSLRLPITVRCGGIMPIQRHGCTRFRTTFLSRKVHCSSLSLSLWLVSIGPASVWRIL